MRYLTIILLFVIFQGILSKSPAQVKDKGIPFIINHSKKEYQAGTQNWDIAQGENNILYIANTQGVIKYNGQIWDLIQMPNRSTVRCLFKDEGGTIYVGAYDEFGCLKPDSTGLITYFSLKDSIPELQTGEIWRIGRGGDILYFQSFNHLISYNPRLNLWDIKETQHTFGFLHSVDNEIFINIRGGEGLVKVVGNGFQKVEGGEIFADWEIWAMTKINGELLIGTQNNGIFILRNGRISPWDAPVNEAVKENRLFSFEKTQDNIFWGTIMDGLIVTNYRGEIITRLNKKSGLNNNTILSLFIDSEKNLWLGLDNGIDQIVIHSPLSYLKTSNDIGSGYCSAKFNDRIYLGTNQGLYWIPADLGSEYSYELLPARNIPECSGQVWSLTIVEDELIVGHNRGAFSIKGNQTRQIYSETGLWNIKKLNRAENLWVAGTYTGLSIFSRNKGSLDFAFNLDGFNESSRTLEIQSDNTIWVGHGYEGIFKITLEEGFTGIKDTKIFDDRSGLGTKTFNELILVDDDITASNSDGIFWYSGSKDDFVKNQYWTKAFSDGGRLIKMFKKDQDRFFYFQDETAGLIYPVEDTLLLKDKAVLALINKSFISPFQNISSIADNQYIIGTDEGFVHLDLNIREEPRDKIDFLFLNFKSLRSNSHINVNLETFTNLGEKSDYHPLKSVPFPDNDVIISFGATYLTSPDQTQYQYKLEGQMKSWSSWGKQGTVSFANLNEGDYKLIVRAKNVYGMDSGEQTLFFHINTPWFRSVFAYLSYFLVIILSIIISLRLWERRLSRERRRSKINEERRMLHKQINLKRKSEFAEKEIVKLRNEKLRSDVRHKSKQLANQTMGVLQKNKFLTEIKDEMLRLKKRAQNEEVKSFMNRMIKKIDRNIEDEDTYKLFETNFDRVHENFLQRLQEEYPHLTSKDLRLCAYLRMNLSSKEIAPLLNISVRGVEISRYRLRKKLNLDHSINLSDYILRY